MTKNFHRYCSQPVKKQMKNLMLSALKSEIEDLGTTKFFFFMLRRVINEIRTDLAGFKINACPIA